MKEKYIFDQGIDKAPGKHVRRITTLYRDLNLLLRLFIQYITVKPKLKGLVILLRFKDSFGLKIVWLKRKSRDRQIDFGLREQGCVTV